MTSSEADSLLPAADTRAMKLDVQQARGAFQEPHVLTGICICFGDAVAYYMPLPTAPPLLSLPPSPSSPPVADRLSSLPPRCRERICQFVGFPPFLSRCPLLRSFFQCEASEPFEQRIEAARSALKGCAAASPDSSALLLVSKLWCNSMRRRVLVEWRNGVCVEWQLLSEIMSDPKVRRPLPSLASCSPVDLRTPFPPSHSCSPSPSHSKALHYR